MIKKIISLIIVFLFTINLFGARSITSFDIARWYLDSRLAVISEVLNVDTVLIADVDSLINDTTFLKYKLVKEKYTIRIDSLIKGSLKDTIIVVESAESMINYSHFSHVSYKINDSTNAVRYSIYQDYHEDFFGRLFLGKSMVIFFDQSSNIVYSSDNKTNDLDLIREVNLKGEHYFNLGVEDLSNDNIFLGPNPFSNYIKVSNKYDFSIV